MTGFPSSLASVTCLLASLSLTSMRITSWKTTCSSSFHFQGSSLSPGSHGGRVLMVFGIFTASF
jgi:hypothetical protein